jgi:hypothetical protein
MTKEIDNGAGRAMVHGSRDILARLNDLARILMTLRGRDALRVPALPTFTAIWLF